MADYMQAPRRNALLGVLADATRAVDDYAQRPDSTMPMGKANALLSVLSRFAGVPAVASTLDRLSYGDSLTTGTGQTLRVRPEVVEAAMAAAPVVSAAGRVAGRGANALADASVRAITRNPQATAQNALAYAAQMRPANPLTVWHGTPHKFDKFDASKIGTGEGAQAYGHGIYVAESPSVAKWYANELSNPLSEDKWTNYLDRAISKADDIVRDNNLGKVSESRLYELQDAAGGELTDAEAAAWNFIIESGGEPQFYKIDLPDSTVSKMLDWDKGGQDVWKEAVRKYGGPQEAAAALRKAGIPGIRYLDGGSRGAGGGTSNFVIFPGEENALTILERNGKPVR